MYTVSQIVEVLISILKYFIQLLIIMIIITVVRKELYLNFLSNTASLVRALFSFSLQLAIVS